MDFLGNLARRTKRTIGHNPVAEGLRDVGSLPVEIAKGLNRGTPWGQANQDVYNSMRGGAIHPHYPVTRFDDGSARVGQIGVPVENGVGNEFGHSYGQYISGVGNYGSLPRLRANNLSVSNQMQPGMESENALNPQNITQGMYRPPALFGVNPVEMDAVPGAGYFQSRPTDELLRRLLRF